MQSPIPQIAHSLRALDGLLSKAEAHCEARGIDPEAILRDRLYPDMAPFTRQVQIASDTAKGAAGRLSGTDIPSSEATFADLHGRIARTLDFIEGVPEAAFEGAEGREVVMRAGTPRETRMSGQGYLELFVLPNLHFHVAIAYAILRHRGVEVGKRDYLGG